ncbi:preprotein translocase subunit SecG [Marivivens donghaensis]|jgi:preprotein translocase subunit SecG|uniref:preprotein translocase subunit SecG n=1 Tax=Marivivens donghaensis TaxID=1699413 RepID=UPI003F6A45BD
MESVVLVIHLILALSLIGVVLMQKSDGGGLGMGSGGGNGLVSARGAATALGKVTWGLAAAFIVTSITLTIIAKQNASTASALDTAVPAVVEEAPAADAPALPGLGGDLLPPSVDSSLPPAPAN